jgi:hypothetical protein
MNRERIFSKYFEDLSEVALRGDAREESFYSSMEHLLEQIGKATGRTDVHVTTLPKSTEAGNPDFRLWNGKDHIIGYIEAKRPSDASLDQIEDSEQLRRYRSTFPNLILTNFFEFRLYRNGERIKSVQAGRPFVLHRLQMVPPLEKPDELWELLDVFLGFTLPETFTAETLAIELAKRTRFLREVVDQQLSEEREAPGELAGFYEAFQKYLIGDLTPEDFADLYAQTITYGLFAARIRTGEGFTRRSAFNLIPRTIGILRDVFRFISLGDLPAQLEWIVDDISEILAVADAPGILDAYYKNGKGSDPIVHFYETFLAQYDPEERERRGVYYTPEPVVSYIVRSLHDILKTEFGMPDGLASEGVTLLDPAAGTMTFVARAAQEAVREFESKYGAGAREDFIRRHILQNFYAFELMMAPYAVGHLKMSFFLEELGLHLADDERIRFYLTNTLDMEELAQSHMPFYSSLAEESHLAGQVKKQQPILVILGNPPYSGISSNMGKWITGLIENYKYVDGQHFSEKKHWLQDDYVKFLRFAQWKIEQSGNGIVSMITNHGYLDNPTFRGMRQSLMRTFDDIYVLDLHGNALKHETCPDGSKDQNVFDIRQGVAIAFFIKMGGKTKRDATVRHSDLWGTRKAKYQWLNENNWETTPWQELNPTSRFYFYVPRNEKITKIYELGLSVTQIFPIFVTGIVTARDRFVFDFDREALLRRIGQFRNLDFSDDFVRTAYKLKDTRGWKLPEKRHKLTALDNWRRHAISCLYRPFDMRWLYYHGDMVDWPRMEVMRHMFKENLALIVPKRVEHVGAWQHALVSSQISDHVAVSLKTIDYHFSLYLYPDMASHDLFTQGGTTERRANINPKLVEALTAAYGLEPSPEEIFHYVYAVLYAPTYREKYAEFLRMDFPRIPFTADHDIFQTLAQLGERLIALHLLKSQELDLPAAHFEGEGDCRVAKSKGKGFRYEAREERIYINKSQYFHPVPPEVWEYRVGGYQVCEKWLKDRKERKLGLDDIRIYCRIVTALKLTIEIQKEIDTRYPSAETATISLRVESDEI